MVATATRPALRCDDDAATDTRLRRCAGRTMRAAGAVCVETMARFIAFYVRSVCQAVNLKYQKICHGLFSIFLIRFF